MLEHIGSPPDTIGHNSPADIESNIDDMTLANTVAINPTIKRFAPLDGKNNPRSRVITGKTSIGQSEIK